MTNLSFILLVLYIIYSQYIINKAYKDCLNRLQSRSLSEYQSVIESVNSTPSKPKPKEPDWR